MNIPNGSSFWVRWTDFDIPSSDDGLGIDDFSLTPLGSAADTAPSVSNTVPANNAKNVPVNTDLTVTFSEPVNVTDPWFTLTCAGNPHAATVSGGPTTFVLNPTVDFTSGEQCTLTILAANVADQDTNDPPDTMAADFTISFTPLDVCAQAFTPIYEIQGSGPAAAITGTDLVTTKGVVVGDYEYPGSGPTSNFLRGFYLQDLTGDDDQSTSDGIFVFNGSNNSVSLGDVVYVTGTAGEFQDQTQISNVTAITKCGTGTVTPVDVTFPVASATFLEQYEGMLVRLPQTLSVTEHFQLGRFGQVVLSAEGKLPQPTNVIEPGALALALQADNDLHKIILDDDSQAQNPDPILFGRNGSPLSASNTLRGGDTVTNIVGVMTYTWAGNAASGNAYRVRPINALGGTIPNFQPSNPRPTSVPNVGGSVRVVGMNLLNFFNTFDGASSNPPFACNLGVGGPLTDCRGADDSAEFDRQWPKTVAAIMAMNPDILGVNELENDGYGSDSAIQFLVNKLNAATAPGTYAFIDADIATGQLNALGTDAIKVSMLYKPSAVTPVGRTAVLNSVAFVNGSDGFPRSRPSLAQAFRVNATGAVFIVDINHLKSKGSACDSPDQGDGQGNCNAVRIRAAQELMAWLATDPTGTGDPDILLIGDYNSYAKEDPITTIKTAGFTNLIEHFLGLDAYSYVFDGQWGYLDHALASPSLLSQVTGVGDYHINADEPSVLDYNVNFKTPNLQTILYAPDQFRMSDHDPVVIGLAPNAPPTVTASFAAATSSCGVNNSKLNVTITDSDPTDTHTTLINWGDGSTSTQNVTPATRSFSLQHTYASPGRYTAIVKVTDSYGHTATTTATVTVNFTTSGILPLIKVDGTSVFKSGSTVPVKVKFMDCTGAAPATLAPTIKLVMLSGETPGREINEPVSTSAADTSGVLRFSTDQYMYNLATKSLPDPSATYQLTITVPATGQIVTATFGLK